MAEADGAKRAEYRRRPAGAGRGRDARDVTTGLAAAVLLHAAILLALIYAPLAPLRPAPERATVSLVVLPSPSQTIRPAPNPQAVPARPSSRIGLAQPNPARMAVLPQPPPARPGASPAPAVPFSPRTPKPGQAETLAARSAAAQEGFVAAAPLSGAFNPPPRYPQAAIDHGEQGSVLLSIHVLAGGRADFVAVTQSSGYRVLDQAAADAVSRWRFQPAMLDGKPVVQVIPFWIHFDLDTQRAAAGQ